MADDNKELNLDDLEGVAGGISPIGLNLKVGPQKVFQETAHTISAAETSGVAARCKSCGQIMEYLGQERVDGGNTGKFKCKNKDCLGFGILKYNDEVNLP